MQTFSTAKINKINQIGGFSEDTIVNLTKM